MLARGGNAVDAALSSPLTVVEPCMNGIGGDAFAIWDGQQLRAQCLEAAHRRCGHGYFVSTDSINATRGWDSVVPG
jgi:gamma-glutamyltranspeptidase/glutathione hydrolase